MDELSGFAGSPLSMAALQNLQADKPAGAEAWKVEVICWRLLKRNQCKAEITA